MGDLINKIKVELEQLIGKENVSTNFYMISDYCMNHVAKNIFAMSKTEPFVVARPLTIDHLVKIIKYADSNEIPIFIRGGGTGYSGGEIPTSSGIVIEMTGMNRIISVDADGRYVTCEAGITVKSLNEYLEKHGLWWPHDPGSRDWATVGGSLSSLGCGAFTTKYGYASNSVTCMKVVTASGEVIELGSKVRNDITSYNLLDLFTSSEGTLGVIAEATLKVFPIPKRREIVISIFERFREAIKTCYDIADYGLYPESLMMEDNLRFALEGLAPHIDLEDQAVKKLQLDSSQAVVIASYAGYDDFVKICVEKTKEIMLSNNGKLIDDKQILNAYWKSKTELPSWSKELEGVKVHSFVPAIPLYRAADFNDIYNKLVLKFDLSKAGARYYVVLPFMECTVSPTVLFNDNDENSVRAYEDFTKSFSEEVSKMGGSPASTTGVGMRLIDIVEKILPDSNKNLVKKIKTALDPKWILSPNKKLKR